MQNRPTTVLLALATAVAATTAACTSDDGAAPLTEADYVDELDAICTATTEELEALPAPPEQISVADFATSAALILASEADDMRRLDAPLEVDDDHRALVLNTDEQAAAWRDVAAEAASGSTAFGTQRIGELTLGRNDLAAEMGAQACVRDGI